MNNITGDHHKWVDITCGTSPRCEALGKQSIMLVVSLPKKYDQEEMKYQIDLGLCVAYRIKVLYS